MNDSAKKKHLYAVEIRHELSPTNVFVLAHTKQQAVNAVADRFITAARAEAMDVLQSGLALADVIDATTGHAQQATLPLDAAPTAAEALEPPVTEEPEHVE